ncbi:MAG: hypothetical protein JO358_15685 [Alphaproteobacteria bacterium]|nr:hypothetical protein [Alphaproteobacteria bacterium]
MAQAAACVHQSYPLKQPRLHSVVGEFGAIQIVPITASQKVLVDVQGRFFNCAGYEDRDHGTALLPIADAWQLIAELTQAVEQAEASFQ